MDEEIIVEEELIEEEINIEEEASEEEIQIEQEDSEEEIDIEEETSVTNMDYNYLRNKPQINEVELINNKNLEELRVHSLTNSEIENLLN